jgi:predicted phage tail protein
LNKIKLRFYGHLKEKLGKEVEVFAETPFEAIRSLSTNFAKQLKAPINVGRWQVKIKEITRVEELYLPVSKVLNIYPSFSPSKQSGWINIGIGSALIVGGLLMSGATFGAATPLSSGMIAAGIGMLTGGLIQLLYPTPKINNTLQTDPEASKYLGAPKNTVATGTRIPIGYGKFRVFGHFISFNISAKDIQI